MFVPILDDRDFEDAPSLRLQNSRWLSLASSRVEDNNDSRLTTSLYFVRRATCEK